MIMTSGTTQRRIRLTSASFDSVPPPVFPLYNAPMANPEHTTFIRGLLRLLALAAVLPLIASAATPRWIETPHHRIKWLDRPGQRPYAAAFLRKDRPAPPPSLARLEVYEALADELLRDDRALVARADAEASLVTEELTRRLTASFEAWKRVAGKLPAGRPDSPLAPVLDRALTGAMGHRAAMLEGLAPERGRSLLERLRREVDDPPLTRALKAQ